MHTTPAQLSQSVCVYLVLCSIYSELFVRSYKVFLPVCIWCSIGVTLVEFQQDLYQQKTVGVVLFAWS